MLEQAALRRGHHEVLPPGPGLDALGQVVEAAADAVPPPVRDAAAVFLGPGHRCAADVAVVEIEPAGEVGREVVAVARGREHRAPELLLLAAGRAVHGEGGDEIIERHERRGRDRDRAEEPAHQAVDGRGHLGPVVVLGVDEQGAPAEDRFAVPQPGEGVALGDRARQVGGGDPIEAPPEVVGGERHDVGAVTATGAVHQRGARVLVPQVGEATRRGRRGSRAASRSGVRRA